MGEYYQWVNVDKKEYLNPVDFNLGAKFHNSTGKGNALLRALYELLDSDWKNDKILFMGDEFTLNEDIDNKVLSELYEQSIEYGYPGFVHDLVCDTYKNVSCLFSEAENEVRDEIEACFIYPDDSVSKHIIESYRFNFEKPYDGMFLKKGKSFKYIINYTKRVYYSFKLTNIRYKNGNLDIYIDPLPHLLGFGRSVECGEWVGDIVGVSDNVPKNFSLIDNLFLSW